MQMVSKRLDLLVLKFNAWDRKSFTEEALAYSRNSMMFFFDYEKIALEYKPENVDFSHRTIKYLQHRLVPSNSFLFLLLSLADIVIGMMLFGFLCVKFRPRVCWIDNTWPAVATGLMKKLGFCNYSIYTPSDWLACGQKQGLLVRYFANNVLWPVMDYLACRLNDHVLNLTSEIGEARYNFWSKAVPKRECVHSRTISINKSILEKPRNKICFLGRVLHDSGLEIVISALQKKWQKNGITLKIIGPTTQYSARLRNFIESNNAHDFVEIFDFIEADKLNDSMADCFCGINLMTNPDSHTIYTIPGKLIEYLQQQMPVIVTQNIGPFHKVIRKNGLGYVIRPTEDELWDAVEDLYRNLKQYQNNILNFVQHQSCGGIEDYIEND